MATQRRLPWFAHLAIMACLVALPLMAKSTGPALLAPAPPVELTTQQDHQRTLRLLGITSLRRGPSGDPNAPDASNADESKATPYTSLPDPLTFDNGRPVKTTRDWTRRRAEIVEHFDREVYGRVPATTPRVKWEVTATTTDTVGGVPMVTKQLVGHVDNSAYPLVSVDIQLTLATPAGASGPVPVIMEFGFAPRPRAANAPPLPAPPPEGTWQEQLARKGWGYAVLVPTSVQADNGAGLTRGIIGLVNKGQPRDLDDWGALRAWPLLTRPMMPRVRPAPLSA